MSYSETIAIKNCKYTKKLKFFGSFSFRNSFRSSQGRLGRIRRDTSCGVSWVKGAAVTAKNTPRLIFSIMFIYGSVLGICWLILFLFVVWFLYFFFFGWPFNIRFNARNWEFYLVSCWIVLNLYKYSCAFQIYHIKLFYYSVPVVRVNIEIERCYELKWLRTLLIK